ncbi:MAG: hypothetical protein IKH03_03655 [Oscillospiraceae bacterium]|nr:hypothetical protein [Oscillospiraceae bacterium]
MKHRSCDPYEAGTREEPTPLSAERIRALTMQRLPARERRPRLSARILLTAAALMVLSVSAFAATGVLGLGDWFRDFFGPLSAEQRGAVETISRELTGAAASGGATLTPLAVLADENVCYLCLRVEAPQGTVLGALPEGWSYKLYGGDGFDEQLRVEPVELHPYRRGMKLGDGGETWSHGFGYGVAEYDLPDDDPTDNTIETMLRITFGQAMDAHAIRLNDGVTKRLSCSGLWVMSPEIDFAEVFRAELTLELESPMQRPSTPLDCAGAAWTDADGVSYTLDALLLSPLSLSFHYSSDLPMPELDRDGLPKDWEKLPQPNAFALVFRDGSVLDCSGLETGSECTGLSVNRLDWKPTWSLWDSIVFDEPLELSRLDHVEYGGHVIPLPADWAASDTD